MRSSKVQPLVGDIRVLQVILSNLSLLVEDSDGTGTNVSRIWVFHSFKLMKKNWLYNVDQRSHIQLINMAEVETPEAQ